jgi:hypothetical protein
MDELLVSYRLFPTPSYLSFLTFSFPKNRVTHLGLGSGLLHRYDLLILHSYKFCFGAIGILLRG